MPRYCRLTRVCLLFVLMLHVGCTLIDDTVASQSYRYRVQRGDTLSAIAARTGCSVVKLQRFNQLSNPDTLAVGQRLLIPKCVLRESARASFASLSRMSLGFAERYRGELVWPVRGGVVRSRFGWRSRRFHEGVDISAPRGTPIHAAHDGEVLYRSSGLRGYGKLVVVKGEDIMTVYGHNSRYRVSHGEHVNKGEVIAEVGSTGNATGPHLHFEVRIPDRTGRYVAVNPAAFY